MNSDAESGFAAPSDESYEPLRRLSVLRNARSSNRLARDLSLEEGEQVDVWCLVLNCFGGVVKVPVQSPDVGG